MSPAAHLDGDTTAGSRIDRLALRLAQRPSPPVPVPPPAASDDGQLSRRKVLTRALGAGALALLPLRFANPTAARAEGYCAAECLNDATSAFDARLTKCYVSAFGTDIPDRKALATYVAAKIRSGGLGALVLANEIASADVCIIGDQIRYHYEAGNCGKPNCGNPKKYPPQATGACQDCKAGSHCCVCRDYNDGKPLPNVLINGGYSCAVYCATLGFTVISDTPC